VDDTLIEGAHSGAITHTTASIDVSYHALSVASVSVNITDDELGAFSTELLTNPGFETAGATAGIAAGWTVQTPSGDKRSCPIDVSKVHSGACAFKFTGSLTDVSKLSQVVDLTGLTFAAGDTLNFSAFFKGNHVSAKIKVTLFVTYTGNLTPVKTSLIVLQNATYTERSMATYTLTSGDVNQIKLVINHQSNGGTLWVDDASLLHTVSAGRNTNTPNVNVRDGATLGLPEVPEGFRK